MIIIANYSIAELRCMHDIFLWMFEQNKQYENKLEAIQVITGIYGTQLRIQNDGQIKVVSAGGKLRDNRKNVEEEKGNMRRRSKYRIINLSFK